MSLFPENLSELGEFIFPNYLTAHCAFLNLFTPNCLVEMKSDLSFFVELNPILYIFPNHCYNYAMKSE
jgi:hypothetical protein